MGDSTSYTVNIRALFDAGDALAKIKNIQTTLNNLKLPDNLRSSFNSAFNSLNKAIEEFLVKSAQGIKTKADSTAINKSFDKMTAEAEKFDALVLKIRNQFGDLIDLSNWIKIDGSVTLQIDKLNKEINDLQLQLNNINAGKLGDLEKILNNIKSKGAHGKGEAALQLFNQNDILGAIKLLDLAIAKQLTMLNSKVDEKGNTIYSFGEAARKTAQENILYFTLMQEVFRRTAEEGSKILESIDFKETEKLLVATLYALLMTDGLNGAATASTGLVSNIHDIEGAFKDATNGAGLFVSEIGLIKSRIQYFFGLANAINLVKRAIRSSFNTVKELDKAMTETAVVTNYTIKDMWKQLPEYTKRANLLGVTTKAAYESATLYYQLGLNTELAAALSTETLKMARIAGLDAADATDRMTNALRGFNMELNATLALRVDDVYSQLAAMSASNVDEISTAMTKVASLAHNANMEFETTAAFLAQIIETTRESAETAGTALKTVVARFSEVKKLYDTDLLKGLDEEGQVIDVNKVSAALRTAGIDLNKYFLGEVGLDDVFMELSEKWDSLTNIQLRYIATLAAGSRQQSRFIALMQDYSRTLELVGAAYSSTGASQKQFEKTQDSMESKLARLKNAWDEFAMGLANNAILKGAVDVLTNILQLVNKITNAFGDGVGSIMKWGALIGSLAGVRGIFKNGGFIDKAAGSFLNNTTLGNILFKGGVLSGNLFGGATAANSTARLIAEEAAKLGTTGPTIVTGGGLLRNLFSRKAVSESVNKYLKAVDLANLANGLANMKNFASGKPMTTPQPPNVADVKGLARLGLRVNNGKLLGGVSKKLAGTKFASSLGKVLGFGETGAAAAAAAGLATALGTVAAAAGAVAIAYKAWYDLSPEGQLKLATEWAETMDKVSENAEKAKNSTKEAYESYQEKNKAVETADTAISRQKAISERNLFINDLLQKDSSYAQYLKTSFDKESGLLTLSIDETDLKKVAQNAEEGAIKAAAGANLALAMKAGKLANVYEALIQRAGANIITKTIKELTETGAVTRAMTPDEITKYLNLLLKQSQQKAAMEAYAKSAYAGMIDSKTLGSEMADLVAGLLAKTFDEDEYLKEVKKGRTLAATYEGEEGAAIWWTRGKKYWRKRYLEVYGYEPEKDLSGALLATAVGEALALLGLEDKVASVSKLALNSLYETLFKALNGEVDIGLWEDTELYINKFKDLLDVLAEDMGYDADKLANILKLNAKTEKELQKSNIATLSAKALKAGASRDVWSTLLGLDKKDIAKVLDFSDAAEQSLGNGFGAFLDNIPYYIELGQLDNLGEFFKSFDLDSPISAFKKLKTVSLDAKDPLRSLAEEILNINSSTFDLGYLTLVFMTSEAYESISENLDKFIEENEEISAKNIEELAESCSDLKTLINDVGISAQGLALAFTAVGKGKASIDGITTSVLEALGASKNTTTAIDELFKRIDEFDAGRDFGKAVNFAYERIDELRESLTNLDFGNETFKKNYLHFFNDYEHFVSLDTERRKSHLEQQIDWIEDLLDNDALGAMRELATKGIGIEQLGDYTFSWDAQGDWDTVAKLVADLLGVSNEIAETIMTAAAKHIPGLLDLMDLKGYENTIKTFNDSIVKDTVITDLELLVLAEAYGKDIDTIYADMQRLSGYGAEIPIKISWQENGLNLTGAALIERFKSVEGAIHDIMSDFVGGGILSGSSVDVDTILNKLLSEYKLSAALATEIADNIVLSVNGKFTKSIQVPVEITDESGKGTGQWEIREVLVSADTVKGLEAEIKLKEELAQWTLMGQTIALAIINGIGEISVNTKANESSLNSTRAAIEQALSGIVVTVSALAGPIKAEGEAKGGYVSYASGSRKIKPGVALTGEEGPELVWNKEGGYAYLAGKNGPEFNNLRPGDLIFPADETKRIFARGETPSLARGGKVVPSYGLGDWNPDGSRKKEKGSGSGSNKDDEFKMDLDKYYNMVEDINELLRLRNLLETDYNLLLKTEGKTGKEIYDNLTRQLTLLRERQEITADLAEKRKQQIIDLVEENQELLKYAWWNNEDLTIEIDWDLVREITDKDEGSEVKDYLSKLEDFLSKYDDMIELLEDIESAVQDILERGKDLYNTLEERVRDALIKQIQDKIDELLDVDKAINDTNQKLFDSMLETLSMQRLLRDNAETESELTDKEKRLAYLQLDSSNANLLEIAKLQKEIDDARLDYTDNLIDQKISELQRQNDEAQELRLLLIELMQRSLDWQEKSGAFWDLAYQYISEGTSEIGALIHESELEKLLKSAEPWDKLSEELKKNWVNDLMDLVALGIAYLEVSRLLEDIGTKEGTSISFTNANGQTLTGKVDKNGNVVVTNSDGSTTTYKDVFLDYHGAYRTFEGKGETKTAQKPTTTTATKPTTKPTTTSGGSGDNKGSNELGPGEWSDWEEFDEELHYRKRLRVKPDPKTGSVWDLEYENHTFGSAYKSGQLYYKKCNKCGYIQEVSQTSSSSLNAEVSNTSMFLKIGSSIKDTSNNLFSLSLEKVKQSIYKVLHQAEVAEALAKLEKEEEEEEKKKKLTFSGKGGGHHFATGGLADFTGPAWLDGTRSNPELVLNSRDTQNFIELKDTLADMRKNGSLSLAGGDSYYEIIVNVDLMSSDYDVDKAIDRIKARLAQDGAYRNVNTLSRLR